jgi:hypothetical protein
MRIFVLAAALLALAGPPALAQSNVPELRVSSYWREDIALESILSPPDTVFVGDTIYPAVMGMNYGRGARSEYMWCLIDNHLDAVVYASIQGFTAPSRDSFIVTFAVPWIAQPAGDYYVRFFFYGGPPRDSWPENDSIGKHFVVLPREGGLYGSRPRNRVRGVWCDDLEVVGFFGIPDTIMAGDTIHPSVLLRNHGFGARSTFLSLALDDGRDRFIYSTIQHFTIPSRDTLRVHFAIPFIFAPGTYTFMAWIPHQDSWPENDSAWKTLVVLPRESGVREFLSRESAGRELRAVPSIARVGGMISVSGLGPGSRAELIDAAGRVRGLLASGSTAIAAPCLPGVYFIRREEDDRTTRVLVQP